MSFLLIAAFCLVLACLPFPLGLSGRVIALLGASWNWVYGLAVLAKQPPIGIGSIAQYLDLEDTLLSEVGLTSTLSACLALFAVLVYRKHSASVLRGSVNIRIPFSLGFAILIAASFSSVYVLVTLGPTNILDYNGYYSLKSLNIIYYNNSFGLAVASTLRPLIIALVMLATIWFCQKRYRLAALSLIPITIGIIIGLAEAGRIVSIYFGIASIGFLLMGRRVSALICGILVILATAYALEGRNHQTLGLSHVPNHLSLALRKQGFIEDVLTNVAAGQFVTSASTRVGHADGYQTAFKVLSFMPSIDAIDHFQSYKVANEQRVNIYIPFNAFSEAFLFGPQWLVLFWAILFISVLCVNSSAKHGHLLYLLLLCLFCLGWSYATQYPIRNSVRYFYLIVAIRLGAPPAVAWWRRQQLQAMRLVSARAEN